MKRPLLTLSLLLITFVLLGRWSGDAPRVALALQGTDIVTTLTSSTPTAAPPTPTAPPNGVAKPAAGGTAGATARPVILRMHVQNLFPAGVGFNVILNVGLRNLKAISIHISQPDANIDVKVDLDLKKSVKLFNDDASDAGYFWPYDLSAGPVPAPFSKVQYAWEVITNDDQSYKSSGDFIAQDTLTGPEPTAKDGPIWQKSGDAPISFYSHNKTLALDLIRSGAEKVYDKVVNDTRIRRELNVVIYDAGVNYCQVEKPASATKPATATAEPAKPFMIWSDPDLHQNIHVPCDPALGDLIYRAHKYVVLHRLSPLLDQLQDQVIGLIAGDAYAVYWQNGAQPPAWFRNGLIQLYALSPRPYTAILVRDASRTGGLLPLEALNTAPDSQASDATTRLWNAQSYLMTLYLASRFGAQMPFTLAQSLGKQPSFDDELARLTSLTPDQLYDGWRTWVLGSGADDALRWTPYLDATPTPSLTSSPLPTRTTTMTPTRTPTPTLAPTITLTPSNTPLPPGSLQTPTPTPQPNAANNRPCPGSVVLLVLPAAAVLANRRKIRRQSP